MFYVSDSYKWDTTQINLFPYKWGQIDTHVVEVTLLHKLPVIRADNSIKSTKDQSIDNN